MKIVVSTIGRAHSFDLAAELQKAGHLTAIYTGYPMFKLRDSGVEASRIRTIPWLMTPYMALMRSRWFRDSSLEREALWQVKNFQDRVVARQLPNCDLVCAMSSMGLRTGRAAQRRGISYACERNSTHIQFQDRIQRDEHERFGFPYRGIDPRIIDIELQEYECADGIIVPSHFAARSLIESGVPEAKAIAVPMVGANLEMFRPGVSSREEFRVLFVGVLGLRKGLPYLLDAFRLAALPRARLVLVGNDQPETEALMRRYPVTRVDRLGHLPIAAVAREMARAHVFVLPSIEEGLAQVQAQAMASGCPVIATPNAGAEDLFDDGVEGFIVPMRDSAAIAARLVELHDDSLRREQMAQASVDRIRRLGGRRTYGELAARAFSDLIGQSKRNSVVADLRNTAIGLS